MYVLLVLSELIVLLKFGLKFGLIWLVVVSNVNIWLWVMLVFVGVWCIVVKVFVVMILFFICVIVMMVLFIICGVKFVGLVDIRLFWVVFIVDVGIVLRRFVRVSVEMLILMMREWCICVAELG